MTKKQLERIAREIILNEKIISSSQDEEEIKKAKSRICFISSQIKSFQDLFILDEIISNKLK